MPNLFAVPKFPDALGQLEYGLDWSEWLVEGDTIVSSVWLVPNGLTVVAQSQTSTTTTVWLKGGVNGQVYNVVNRITTASSPSRIDDRTIQITMQPR